MLPERVNQYLTLDNGLLEKEVDDMRAEKV
jgi:hypothetical protein